MRLILIRHGHTAANGGNQRRLSGWTDLPLTERGYQQVHRLRQGLAAAPPFAAIYSSPLTRARETAAALAGAGLGPLRLLPELREIHCGSVDGLLVSEVRECFADLWRANLRQDDEDFRWPGGESYREFRSRCLAAVRAIAPPHRHGRVAVVTHAGVISQIVGFLEGVGAASWERFRPDNTALTEIAWFQESGTLITFDDRAHLSPPQGRELVA